MKTLSYTYNSVPLLAKMSLPDTTYKLIPYVATLILLAFTSKNSAAPRADGVPATISLNVNRAGLPRESFFFTTIQKSYNE